MADQWGEGTVLGENTQKSNMYLITRVIQFWGVNNRFGGSSGERKWRGLRDWCSW